MINSPLIFKKKGILSMMKKDRSSIIKKKPFPVKILITISEWSYNNIRFLNQELFKIFIYNIGKLLRNIYPISSAKSWWPTLSLNRNIFFFIQNTVN